MFTIRIHLTDVEIKYNSINRLSVGSISYTFKNVWADSGDSKHFLKPALYKIL